MTVQARARGAVAAGFMALALPAAATAVLLALALSTAAGAEGPAVDGRLSTGCYVFQRLPGCAGETSHLRLYESLALNARRIAGPRVSLHTQLTYAEDFGDGLTGDPRLWLPSAHLDWRTAFGFLRAGRQFVWGGPASGRLDGLRLRAARDGWGTADAFAGVRSSLDVRDGFDSWNESHMFGGRVQWTRWRRTELAAGFVELSRAPRRYTTPGSYSEDDYWLNRDVSALRQRLVGLEVAQAISARLRLQGRCDYDLPGLRVRLGELVGRWSAKRMQVSGEYVYRSPLLDANSILSVFGGAANQEVAARLYVPFGPGLGAFARVAHLLLDGDSGTRGAVGLRLRGGTLGVTAADGYGGSRWGVTGLYAWRVQRGLRVRVGSNYGSYRAFETDRDREDSLVGTLGATWQPSRTFDLDAEVQGLQNAAADADLRLMLRATYRFRSGERPAEGILWGEGASSAGGSWR